MASKTQILDRMATRAPFGVWIPADFLDLGSRAAVDQTLSRLAGAGEIRRIVRGLYDRPRINSLTGKLTYPDPDQIIDALSRRDQTRMLVDGMTAANDLRLTNAVPAKIIVHTDARLHALKFGGQTITFKVTAPSRLYWAGRPGMRVVQALRWLHDVLDGDGDRIAGILARIFADPKHGAAITADLRQGFTTLPGWMRNFLRPLLDSVPPNQITRSPKQQAGDQQQ